MAAPVREVFFYGLFMDPELLRAQGIDPPPPRRAHLDGFALRIGTRATLVPCAGAQAHGLIYSLPKAEVQALYAAPGLEDYHAEGVLAHLEDGNSWPVECYRLATTPMPHERNEEYARKLRDVLERLEFPPSALATVDAAQAAGNAGGS